MFLNAFKNLFTPKATKTALKKGIRRRLELLGLEERIVPAVPFSPAFPHALSITTGSGAATTSASFSVTFNQSVIGVDTADFNLITTGSVAGGAISSVTGSGANYTVNVTGITGSGTLGVNLVDLPSITALPSFAAKQDFATGQNPSYVTLGDVNGDGRLDIITSNFGDNTGSVLLGNGNGTFAAQTTFATGNSPSSVTLGDVNGDGKLDIITANNNFSGSVSVLLGNGNGTFQSQQTFATGIFTNSVILGDVNGDGKLDIVTANRNSNNASVLLGNGDGTFQAQQTFATGTKPFTVTLGDVNGDGRLDIITANAVSNNTSVLLGNGNGTFQAQQTFATGAEPYCVTLGDVNGDGRLDIITGNYNIGDVSVLLGNGNGTFQPKTDFSTGGGHLYSVTLGDVNGDGKLDIIAANQVYNNASVLLGNGNGTFQTQADFATDVNPYAITMGDVNADGRLDIITGNQGSPTVSVLLGTGGSAITANFAPQQSFGAGTPYSVTLGDVNGDGRLDIVTGRFDSNNTSVLLGNGDGTFQAQQTFLTGSNPRGVALGDVNGDGKLDIITANYGSANASVLLGNGNGTFQPNTDFATGTGTNPVSVALGDVNGDGKIDIITANRDGNSASVLLGNGDGTFQAQQTFFTGQFSNPRSVALGDVNSDGILDIITANYGSGSACVLLGNGDGTFQAEQTFATKLSSRSVALGDVNGDGRLDIITANNNDLSVSVLLGNGNGTFQAQQTFATGFRPYNVTLGDVNGDGNLDIITANNGSGKSASVLLGNGNGTFKPKTDFATQPYTFTVTSGDVNGDGRLDIITGNFFSNNVSVLLNSLAFTGQTATVSNGPSVTSNTSNLAVTATTLIITGSGFDTTAGNNTVTLSSGTGTVTSATATQLTVTFNTPPSVGNLTAVVTSNGSSSGSPVQVASVVGAANTPTFGTPTATADGFTVQISNYDPNFTYGGTATANGTVAISNTGLVTVTGVAANTSSTATITTTRTNYVSGSAQVTASSLNAANTPAFGAPTPTADGFTVQITNYDANFTYGGTATAGGTVAISNTGLVTVTGVAPNTSSTATIITTRTNYVSGSALVTATSLNAANIPVFGATTATADGFTVQITNYNGAFTYGGTATANGIVTISNTGLVTVTGVAANTSSTAIITTTQTGFANGSAQVTAISLGSRPLITGTPSLPSSSGPSTINLYDATTGQPNGTAVPFPGYDGPVKVASGDFNNDGVAELVAGAGVGGGPAIAILNSQTGEILETFFAFSPAFTGGIFVAVQDTNGDGILDIIAAAGPGGGPEVRIFNGDGLTVLRSFFAYAQDFSGGVSVASIDFNNDGILDLVTGAGLGGAPHVKVFDGATNAVISQWYAYPTDFTGGVFVAVGDIGNDGTFEVVTGAGIGGAPVVAVWDPFTGALISQFMAYAEVFTGGVRVAINDGNGDGIADLITGAGPSGGPHVKVFSFPDLDILFQFYSGEESNPGGVFVS